MKRLWFWTLILSLTAACTVATPSAPTALPISAPATDLTRTDTQGAVEFAVSPLNLGANATTLEFKVVMDTHSIDLSWDLAAQSMLKTDTGLEITGSQWTAGSGHHYESTLVFPAQTKDGQALLAAANTLTLVIKNTDVPERTFVWQLTP
jgi:hypothetical protein